MKQKDNGLITIFSKRIYDENIINIDYLNVLTLNQNKAIIKEYMLLYKIDHFFEYVKINGLEDKDIILEQNNFIKKHCFVKSPKSKIDFNVKLERKDLIALMRYTIDKSFNLGNYIESTVYSTACARKTADTELRELEIEKTKENIKAIKKRIKSCKSKLTQFLNMRSLAYKVQKYIKQGKELPKSLKVTNKNLKIEFNYGNSKFIYKEEIYTPHVFIHRVLNIEINRLKSNLGNLNGKLNNLNIKLNKMKKNNLIPVMFGTKNFFKAQFTKNEYKGDSSLKHTIRHNRWLNEFRYRRNNKFTVQGITLSPNSNYVFSYNPEEKFLDSKLQGPPVYEYNVLLKHKEQKVTLKNVEFPYGKEMLIATLNRKERSPIQYSIENHKDYYIIKATFKPVKENYFEIISLEHGVLAFDINYGFLAYAVLNKKGQLIKHSTIPFKPGNVKSIELAMVKIVNLAKYFNTPIAMEDLDLNKKISSTKYGSKKRKRMLNTMCVTKINDSIRARSSKVGVFIYKTNPAYTSLLSKVSAMGICGISVHEGAAIKIGRRVLGFSERLPKDYRMILKPISKDKRLYSLNNVLSKFNNKVFFSRELRSRLKFITNLAGLESLLKELNAV